MLMQHWSGAVIGAAGPKRKAPTRWHVRLVPIAPNAPQQKSTAIRTPRRRGPTRAAGRVRPSALWPPCGICYLAPIICSWLPKLYGAHKLPIGGDSVLR